MLKIKKLRASTHRKTIVAAIHDSAPLFALEAGVTKTEALIAAVRSGAQLAVFPESFLPGFPIWCGLYRPIDGHRFFRRFAENALAIDND